MLVYIASKYNEKTTGAKLRNTHISIDAGIELYKKSNHKHIPHCPLLTHWIEERMDYNGEPPRENEFWYEYDNQIIPLCGALIKLTKPGESKGADMEEQLANKLEIPVYYSVDEFLESEK